MSALLLGKIAVVVGTAFYKL